MKTKSLSASIGAFDQTKVTTGPNVSTYIRDHLLANGGKETGDNAFEGSF
ncbi:MAG: hypothetical protein U1F13_03275 [Acinetobacter parvus]